MAQRRLPTRSARPRTMRWSAVAWLLFLASVALAQDKNAQVAPAAQNAAPKQGHLIPVPLPITPTIDAQVQRMIDQVVDAVPADGARPVLVLEFRPPPNQQGEGTQLERGAKSLAKFLVGPKLSRVRTVAWLPQSVQGHAVLPILACEEIVMHPDATLGDAGHDEKSIDPDMQASYEFIAKQRLTIPLPVVRGMLDKELGVVKVQTLKGAQYLLASELEEFKKTNAVSDIDTHVKDPGQPARYSGRDLRIKYGFVSHLASDKRELAAALGLNERSVEEDPLLGTPGKPVLVRLDGPIGADKVNFILRTLGKRLDDGDVNFICLEIDSAGGSLADSVRLAQYFGELNLRQVRTVAYIPRQARGDAALAALACDHLVMRPEAVIGGPGETNLDPRLREDLAATVKQIAQQRARSWSLPLALVDTEVPVARFVHERDQRVAFFSPEEINEQEQPGAWQKSSDIDVRSGLTGAKAEEARLTRFLVADFDELQKLYRLESEPERLHANWAHLLIEQLARPEISFFLLFVAFFAMMFELMSPGVGLPGFISAVCFLLFFWANVLHGTAGALEVLLFVGGLAFLAIELFALPGFGIFGIGGVLMMIASVILASQTFVIPRNEYQLEQLPRGLFMVTAAGAGVIVSLVLFRKFLHKAPLVNRMLLEPPQGEALSQQSRRESFATFDHLLHKRGSTLTPLTPAGKARFGDDYVDVVSDGDFLPTGADIYVVEIAGSRVVVRAVS